MKAFQDIFLGPLKAMLMRVLQQQLSKYIHNIELEELGLMGGDVVLENLELRKDVLHDIGGISTDYDFSRGFIKELRIHIPWTRLQSRPIEIKVKTVEIIITPITQTASQRSGTTWQHSRQGSTDEQGSPAGPSGWIQQLLTKVLANMSIEVSNLVLKYEDADVVLSAALKSLVCFSAHPDREWAPAFASLDDPFGFLHKLVRASDLTVCLDRYCAPDSTRRRQVQAFEVPILNRASFEVRLLACVWLVAPGPPESSLAGWEDQQMQHEEWQEGTDMESVGMPPSPGRSGARRGNQWGVREDPKPSPAPKPHRPSVTALGRLVGGERRSVNGDETAIDLSGSGSTTLDSEGEIDQLPIPSVCRLLRDGWSRRASSSYSPFFDGEGAWSRSESARGSMQEEEDAHLSTPCTSEGGGGGKAEGARREGGEDREMPVPMIAADVLVADLSFSLSNLQVRMMTELVDRAVRHVARNASRNVPVQPHPPPEVSSETAPVTSNWWPYFWRGTEEESDGDLPGRVEGGTNSNTSDSMVGKSGPVPLEPREGGAKFVVASLSVSRVSLHLLEHREQTGRGRAGEKAEEEAEDDEETESISVPVHGLGTVSVRSTPARARKQSLPPPVAFVVAQVENISVDAHVLPGDLELSADVKVAVSSVAVKHARLDDDAAALPDRGFPEKTETRSLDYLAPVISMGAAVDLDADTPRREISTDSTGGSERPTSATAAQRCLVEIARNPPQSDPSGGEAGVSTGFRGEEGAKTRGRVAQVSPQGFPAPPRWSPALSSSTTPQPAPNECALQYRLLKRKGICTPIPGSSRDVGRVTDALASSVSTLTCHDMAVGALRVQLAEVLLEKLLRFSGVLGRRDKEAEEGGEEGINKTGDRHSVGPSPTAAPVSLVEVQGQPLRASRLSPRTSDAVSGSGITSPKALPPPSPASSFETSVHFALHSVVVAVDLSGVQGGYEAGQAGIALCVLSLKQLEVSGSQSTSYVGEMGWKNHQHHQHRGGEDHAIPPSKRGPDEESQTVCSLVLEKLLVALVDYSALATDVREPLTVRGSPTLMSRSLARVVFLAGGNATGLRRLVALDRTRATAEILSKCAGDARAGGLVGLAAERNATRSVPDFLFNASLESVEICASVGAALLVMEACFLAKRATRKHPRANTALGGAMSLGTRWGQGWRRGIAASFQGISVGGFVKSGGGQLTGNMRRLCVGQVRDSDPTPVESVANVSDVATFEALLGEGDREGLSWDVEISNQAGLASVKLTSVFKSATLHYSNAQKAYREVVSMIAEWKVGAARLADDSPADIVERVHRPNFEFVIRGSLVAFHLPFDLELEVEGVRLGTSPSRGPSMALGRGADRANGDLDLHLSAGDVQVYHLTHGSRGLPKGAGPPAIRCAARGIVAIRPRANATTVSLESEHVHVRLTPAFCASFGMFVRCMVGPPPRPLSAESALQAALARGQTPPVSFTFLLKVNTVNVDFLTGPCNPSAVSAAFVVGGVAMRQHATGATLPDPGTQASFEMSFEAVEGTQRRDPWLGAPALPRQAVRLIGSFLEKAPGSGGNDAPEFRVLCAWLSVRMRADGENMRIGTSYTQPFVVSLGTSNKAEQAFSVKTTSSGPRHRLVNSLALRLAPVLLACYPPTFRILVGHYNRFATNAFRSFRSRADVPRKRVAVVSYDIDIRGCGAVLLASLMDGARGLELSAGEVIFKENTAARAAAVTSNAGTGASSSPLAADAPNAGDTTLAMSGYVGPVGIMFLRDWRSALPATRGGLVEQAGKAAAGEQLCAPIDLRWAVFYDKLDRCRQDVSLSSVQFYLEQLHFDLCVRVAQIFVASDYPGALPPQLAPQRAELSERAAASASGSAESDINGSVNSFLATSLRLPLLQFVLANGKRNGPFPPVLEFDMASVRLARGGVLTVRHLSVNSWSQDVNTPVKSPIPTRANVSGCGYRVLGRSGQSDESSKDFLRMEVRVPEVPPTRPGTLDPKQPQLDVVCQVQPFDVHINPSVLRSLTAYIAPVPFVNGSPEDEEIPFPLRHPLLVAPCRSSGNSSPSTTRDDDGTARDEGAGAWRGLAGEKVSDDFEKSAMTASASVRLLASQISVELSSYSGGPAFMASTSHVFLRAITWPSDAVRERRGNGGGVQAGPEVFARLSRVSCRVRCADGPVTLAGAASGGAADPQRDARAGYPSSLGDVVLKPCDVDVHLTRPGATASGIVASEFSAAQGWHAGIYVDEVYLRFGALHTRSLELLADIFLPAVAAAEVTAIELSRGQRTLGMVPGRQGKSGRHVNDLLSLDRVECAESAVDAAAVKPGPGQAVYYGVGSNGQSPQGRLEGTDVGVTTLEGAEGEKEEEEEEEEEERGTGGDGWVHCCEWCYWGLRRVAQITLPYASLCASVPLLEGLAVDSLEVELSFVDPLTGIFKEATRFKVPCQLPSGSSDEMFVGRPHITVEASQPILSRTWRLSWRIPTWLGFESVGGRGAPKASAISAWSSALLRALSVRSSPAGAMVGPSYVSATLVAHRLTLALVTQGELVSSSSTPSSLSPGEREGRHRLQAEEIVRVVVGDVNVFAEAGAAARLVSIAARGSAVVAVDVQDFSNFLRLPLLSQALVKFDVSTSSSSGGDGGGGSDGGSCATTESEEEERLLSLFRPVASSVLEVHGAVVSVSVTAVQCVEQCIAELAQRPPGVFAEGRESVARHDKTAAIVGTSALTPSIPPSPAPPRHSRTRGKRYVVTNHTDRGLWFGQVSTTETLCLGAGEETSYRWRTIPTLAPGAAGRKDDSSRLVLMLRIALHRDSGRGGGSTRTSARSGGVFGAWTEPFPADHAGTFMRLLRGAEPERSATGVEASGTSHEESAAMMVPLWIEVTKEGLETRVAFYGEWVFTNHLPQEVQVAWVTSAGMGNTGRRLVEPPGTRGALNLRAYEPHQEAAEGSEETAEALPCPESCSALTASSAPSGARQGQGGRFSELMLEFRLATPDATAFVGSVGPPPAAAEGSVVREAWREGGSGSSSDQRRVNGSSKGRGEEEDEEESIGAPWGITRQSEWVEVRPSVYLALISCASTDPGTSGFVFWCVASRQVSHLHGYGARVPRAAGHRNHLGQMRIDLHPVALVWNHCSQPMRAVLNHGGGNGGWSERRPAELVEPRAREGAPSGYSLSRSTAVIQPGGRTAVCQQPFVDYDLEVASAATARGAGNRAPPFVVTVSSGLLSRRCKSTWLPLHSRALTDDVLCPLVVVVSRLLDANWPSLSIRVHPGLSVQNHLSVPLSVRMVFARPLHGTEQLSPVRKGEVESASAVVAERPEWMPIKHEDHAAEPLLSRESSGGSESTSIGGDGDGGSGALSRVTRVLSVPAQSCESTWDLFHSEGSPISFLLPEVSLELGVDPRPAAGVAGSGAGIGSPQVPSEETVEDVPASLEPLDFATCASRRLKVRLNADLNELVLIPWGGNDQGAVLPVFLTLEREIVLGGVELIRVVVHPRVVVHNATGRAVSLSLLGPSQKASTHDGTHKPEGSVGLVNGAPEDFLPIRRVHLASEGSGSSMNLLAMPGRCVTQGPDDSYDSSTREQVTGAPAPDEGGGGGAGRIINGPGFPPDAAPSPGLLGKLSRMLKGRRSKPEPPHPAGFFADLEVAFGRDNNAHIGNPASVAGVGASITGSVGEEAKSKWTAGGSLRNAPFDDLAVFSLNEKSAGSALVSRPSSLKVRSSRNRAVRVCVAVDSPASEPMSTSHTRHVLLYLDPQPDLTICNRSSGPVTLFFDCGTLVEVGPGGTEEHSWKSKSIARNGSSSGGGGGGSSNHTSSPARRTPSVGTPGRRSLERSDSYRDAAGEGLNTMVPHTPTRSRTPLLPPGAPAGTNSAPGMPAGSRRSCISSQATRTPRPPGKLGGDATLQHWFRCKGGGKDDTSLPWADPLWVARGVQVMRFDPPSSSNGDRESRHYPETPRGVGDGGSDSIGDGDGQDGFGAGSAREVQVHVVERAGGFVMSFAEGGFDGTSSDGVGSVEGCAEDATTENREALRHWCSTLEQHAVITVSGTTIQLLDDSNLHPVATVDEEKTSSARMASGRAGTTDGWMGRAWEEPEGLLSDRASAHLPAAAIPAILSAFIDASSVRLWRAAPVVRPGMSSLDLERSWHLKDRVGIDVCLGRLQIDNHVAGHRLPVLFCFRSGGELVQDSERGAGVDGGGEGGCRFMMSLVLAETWEHSRVPSYVEKVSVRSSPIDVCFEDSLLPPLLLLLERAGIGGGVLGEGPSTFTTATGDGRSGLLTTEGGPQLLPPALSASMTPRLFIQRVDIGALVVRATVQGYIPGKQVFLALDKSPLLFRPVSLRGVLARPDEIAEQIATNYAVDALLRSLAVVGSLEALGSPTTLLSEWGKGVYDLFAMPIKAMPQGPSSTVRATFRGVSSLLRHASAGTLSSVSGVTNALSRNLGSQVVRPIAGTMGLVHRTSRSLIASIGVDSEWSHAEETAAATPATAYLNADLWYRCCLLPAEHEFLYRTPALCSNASYSQANVPVTIVLSSKAVFLYRGGSGCEMLWKQIEHEDITFVEQSAEHAPAELILNARGYRRPRTATSPLPVTRSADTAAAVAAAPSPRTPSPAAEAAAAAAAARAAAIDSAGVPGGRGAATATLEAEVVAVGGLLMKLSLPSSACCRELAQLLHDLSDKT